MWWRVVRVVVETAATILDAVAAVPEVSVLEQDFRSQPERITRLPLAVAARVAQVRLLQEGQMVATLFFLPSLPQAAVAVAQ